MSDAFLFQNVMASVGVLVEYRLQDQAVQSQTEFPEIFTKQ